MPSEEQIERAWLEISMAHPDQCDFDKDRSITRAALTAAEVKPRVKHLDWSGDGPSYAYAEATKTAYFVAFEEEKYWACWDAALPPYDTIDAAKEAAQADYEARVLSALEGE